MKTVADNNQSINKISYCQQLPTLQNESLQKTKQRKKRNEAITISPNEIDESTHCFRTDFLRKIKSKNGTCTRIKKLRRKLRLFQGGRQRLT